MCIYHNSSEKLISEGTSLRRFGQNSIKYALLTIGHNLEVSRLLPGHFAHPPPCETYY